MRGIGCAFGGDRHAGDVIFVTADARGVTPAPCQPSERAELGPMDGRLTRSR